VLSYDAEAGPRQFERLEHAAAESRLTVPIAEAFPLDGAAKAHERLREGRILGRIVLKIRRGSR
jgi:D-arabinose 1-dehydrogenase-like Zn-dependent alcohol dehydrogenase